MKPIIETLIDMGLLVDQSGKAFNSLESTGIKFGRALENMFERVLEKLENLIEALMKPLPPVGGRVTPPTAIYTGREAVAKHRGGMITAHNGMFVGNMAADEVPIMAQVGEGILNRSATRMIGGRSGIDALNMGRISMPSMPSPWASGISAPSNSNGGMSSREGDFNVTLGPGAVQINGTGLNGDQIAEAIVRQLPVAISQNRGGIRTTLRRQVRA